MTMGGEVANLEAARRGDLKFYSTREAAEYLRMTVPALIKNINKGLVVPVVRDSLRLRRLPAARLAPRPRTNWLREST